MKYIFSLAFLSVVCFGSAYAAPVNPQIGLEEFKKFVAQETPVYKMGDREIQFLSFSPSTLGYIPGYFHLKHNPWRMPSIYHDSDPSEGTCDIVQDYIQEKWYVDCTSDDYAERTYLKIEVMSHTRIKIIYSNRGQDDAGLILERANTNVRILL